MMSDVDVDQITFLKRAETFLNGLTFKNQQKIEEKQSIKKHKGVCSGLTVMMIRAWMIHEEEKYVERMKTFCGKEFDDIESDGKLLKSFQEACQLFSDPKLEKSTIQSIIDKYRGFNNLLADLIATNVEKIRLLNDKINEQTLVLRLMKPDNKNPLYLQYKTELDKLRNERVGLIKEIVLDKEIFLSEKDKIKLDDIQVSVQLDEKDNDRLKDKKNQLKKKLEFSEEIYIFIQSLLFAHRMDVPEFIIEDRELGKSRVAHQEDVVDLIKIIAPDKGAPIEKTLSFGFLFENKKELMAILGLSVKIGDMVYLSSCHFKKGHAMFLIRQSQEQWLLIDPNAFTIPKPLNSEELGSLIKTNLISSFKLDTSGYLPIEFEVIKRTDQPVANEVRPTEEQLVQTICGMRTTPIRNPDFNIETRDNISALAVAASSGNVRLVGSLMNHGANPTPTAMTFARTSAMQNQLRGGMGSYIKRNWKRMLAGTLITAAIIAGTVLSFGALGIGLGIAAIFATVLGGVSMGTTVIATHTMDPLYSQSQVSDKVHVKSSIVTRSTNVNDQTMKLKSKDTVPNQQIPHHNRFTKEAKTAAPTNNDEQTVIKKLSR